jgi:hypothetical protein
VVKKSISLTLTEEEIINSILNTDAREIALFVYRDGITLDKVAERFGVSIPDVSRELRHAQSFVGHIVLQRLFADS